ncbi:biogenesis of lysosome-related organelles complex 1 subunit 5-like [Brevipalpus obovatus]|uniref:biogenesis of lysosome-related organelles complex 1 subunit 5-like n=1 Tax=Brevipalpus obovatus TaxID=246614 RepID=UPI003D9E39BF
MFAIGDEICTRLSDHKCFTSGELRYFVKRFEENRKDHEVDQVDFLEQNVKEIGEERIDEMRRAMKACNLDKITRDVNHLLKNSKEILSQENKCKEIREHKIKEQRDKYQVEKEIILKDYERKRVEQDEAFMVKANDLRKHYIELESQWNTHMK